MEENTKTWLRKREVVTLMQEAGLTKTDIQTVDNYYKQGRLPGKRLFPVLGGRIVIFKKSDVEAFIAELAEHEPHEGEQRGSANGIGK